MKRCVCLSLVLLGLLFSTGAATQSPTPGLTTSSLATTSTSPPNTTTAGAATGKPDSSTSTSQPALSTSAGPKPITANPTTPGSTATGSSEQTTAESASDVTTGANVTDSTVSPTDSPATTAANTTATPAVVTTTPLPSDTTTPNSTAVVTSTPAQTTTSARTAAAPTTTSAPVATDVVISETNLLLASTSLFVELKGSANESLSGLTLVIFNATSATESLRVDFSDTDTFLASGYFKKDIDPTEKVQKLQTVMIGLYQTKDYNSSLPNKNIKDFVIFSSNSSAAVNPSFQEVFLPDEKSVTLVKSGLNPSQNLSLSRCGSRDAQKDANLFVLATVSAGGSNACNLTMPNSTVWTLGLYRKKNLCDQDKAEERQERDRVENHLVTLINQRCHCGLTTLLVDVVGNLTCVRNLYMDFKIQESYEGQADMVISAFVSLAHDKASFMMGGEEYRVLNCVTNCSKYPHPPSHGSSKDGSTMTIAVVLSCVCVFLIILVAVILYMRGRRRGIIRQFRMTRLQEDDDMDDMDDFIGGGGEASFSTRHR